MVPVGKERPRITIRGGEPRAYTPAKTTEAETAIRDAFRLAYPGHVPTALPVTLSVIATRPMPKSWSRKRQLANVGHWCTSKPDADNIGKLVCDALNGVLYDDDSQVVCLTVTKYWGDTGIVRIIAEVGA